MQNLINFAINFAIKFFSKKLVFNAIVLSLLIYIKKAK